MNLTHQPVYQKTSSSNGKRPTIDQLIRWRLIRELGCIVPRCLNKRPAIHHCGTGAGGRKDHDKVIGLCYDHHQGRQGVHTMSRPLWVAEFGTEEELMRKTALLLGENHA